MKGNRLYDGGLIILGVVVLLGLLGGGLASGKLSTFFGGVKVSQSQLDAAHQAYTGAFLIPSIGYRCLYDNRPDGCPADKATGRKLASNPCPAGQHATLQNICAERAVVVRLQDTDKIVQDAFTKVDADFAACTVASGSMECADLGTAYKTLLTAIDAAKALMAQFAIGG